MPFSYVVKLIYSLSCVPPDKIVEAYEKVVLDYVSEHQEEEGFVECEEEIDEFLGYVEKTWIGRKSARTGERSRPLFPKSGWNQYDNIMDGKQITNNISESFNNTWTGSLERRASLFNVIDAFKKRDSWSEVTFRENCLAVNVNVDERKGRAKERLAMREDLRKLCENAHTMPLKTYMEFVVGQFKND